MRGTFLSLIIRRTAWSLGLAVLSSAPLRASDPPEATITAPSGAVTATVNQTIPFTATSSNAAGYDLYTVNSYAWTFGDGTTGASASTSHAYTTAGTYTVTLTVNYTGKTCSRMDQNGNCTAYQGQPKTATTTRTITVQPPPAITSFSASSSTVEVGKPVTLSWATTNATSLSISGVGTVTGTSVTVSPTATTTYTLTATGGGASATASVTVSTYTLSVTISPGSASLLLGGSQAFTGSVNPANQGLSWNATGGSLSGSTFTATASGTFTVSVASAEDPTRTASATVTVASVSVAAPVPTPSSAQTFVGGTVSFSALVSGAVNKGVTWSVSGGGSISAAGVFTASTKGAWTVTAKSLADPTKTATTTLTVVPLVVTALPATSTVKSGETETLTATVTGPGTPSQGVTWSVVTAGGGTIVPTTGVYTAPATAGDYVVKAASTQDPTCFGTTTIHVPGWTLVWKKDVLYVGTKEVAEIDASGKTWVEFDDHLGSPRYEWDGTAVAGVDNVHLIAQKYGPFGEYLNDPATQAKFEKGFTNHEQTDPSGLIYMQSRFYLPMYGRFASPDGPGNDQHFEQTQSWNTYSYLQNDPTMRIDPTGEVGISDVLNLVMNLSTAYAIHQAMAPKPPPLTPQQVAAAQEQQEANLAQMKEVTNRVMMVLPMLGGLMSEPIEEAPEPEIETEPIPVVEPITAEPVVTPEPATELEGAGGTAGRGKNRLQPDPQATGEHSTFKRGADGSVSNHAEYKPNAKNPSGFQEVKRVDVSGKAHTNPDGTVVQTPHVKEAGTKGVRPARPDELPRRN